jgi:ankyrin repeat protein
LNTIVQFLAEHGAELDVKNKRGLTPLATAVNQSGADVARPTEGRRRTSDLLLKLGATE